MATYYDQFYIMDPGSPPAAGTALSPTTYEIVDRNNDNWISSSNSARDTINGQRVEDVWRGDTITIERPNGVQETITGDTFYLRDGSAVFTPSDGTILHNATFISSTYVTQSTQAPVGDLGPECFLAGTRIDTPDGPRPVERLKAGDLVITEDDGPQPLLWTGGRVCRGVGAYAPIRFAPGAMGNRRALYVSQQHRMLLRGWRAEIACAHSEVLVAAKHLVNGKSIRVAPRPRVQYRHLLFARHHILMAEGAPTESLFPGNVVLEDDHGIAREIRTAWMRASDAPIETMVTARQVARGPELALLVA
ncbi:Hint domain-containing protein [Thioclava sp. F28-4]|uniref:Hint domain-containing protein n=1 Tax=Thioclava sp. F28-4 TaxID=1915315 RepID=UPI000997954D|nr:Hint domain-containing protein [Thioclava sp. F28-4]OOY02888.1 hypothetical protein BMI87_20510 [Thioclava sp. F28-4]